MTQITKIGAIEWTFFEFPANMAAMSLPVPRAFQFLIVALPLNMPVCDESAAAMPRMISVAEVIDVCQSKGLAEAAEKGDRLGWPRLSDAEIDKWNSAFAGYNHRVVQTIGWRRGPEDADGLLSFWVAAGPDAVRVCDYATGDGAGLRDELSAKFGAPARFDNYGAAAMVFWRFGELEVSYVQLGSITSVKFVHHD